MKGLDAQDSLGEGQESKVKQSVIYNVLNGRGMCTVLLAWRVRDIPWKSYEYSGA